MGKSERESGVCDGCGKDRKVQPIDSGQKLCDACLRVLRPPRAKNLATQRTLDEWASVGVVLSPQTTRDEAKQLAADYEDALYYIESVIREVESVRPSDRTRLDERRDEAVRKLFNTDLSMARRMAQKHRDRREAAERRFGDAYRSRGQDGRIYDDNGNFLAWWDFLETLDHDDLYAAALKTLR